jgi:hypothetical protein
MIGWVLRVLGMAVLIAVAVTRSRGDEWLSIGAFLDVGTDGDQEPLGSRGDLGDRGVERLAVPGGRRAKAADLANVLAGCRLDLTRRCGNVGDAEGSDASTHARSVPAGSKTTLVRARITAPQARLGDATCNAAVIRPDWRLGMMAATE